MGKGLYFADDKDVLDLLESSKRRLTAEVLREFLLRRGILVSPETSKDDLFKRISMWTLDWEEVRWLMDKTAPADRSERFASTVIPGAFKSADVRAALDSLQRGNALGQLESFVPAQTHAGTVSVAVTYTELDPAKTRLRQKRLRDGSITLDISDAGVTVRHEANDKMAGVAEEVLKALAELKGGEVKPRRIELSHLPSSESRTKFFLTLLESIHGLKTQDVSRVSVQRAKPLETEEGKQEADDELEIMQSQVRGAMLRGGSLITSPEFQMLKKDFFLCGLEWTSQEAGEKGRMIRFEAGFDDTEHCRGFRYKVKGVIERKKTGDGHEFVQTARACTEVENSKFVELLESACHLALDTVEGSASRSDKELAVKGTAGEAANG